MRTYFEAGHYEGPNRHRLRTRRISEALPILKEAAFRSAIDVVLQGLSEVALLSLSTSTLG